MEVYYAAAHRVNMIAFLPTFGEVPFQKCPAIPASRKCGRLGAGYEGSRFGASLNDKAHVVKPA